MAKYLHRKCELESYRKAGYNELACAIVYKAVEDYDKAIRNNNKRNITELERFFNSQWFTELCDLDAEYLMKEVKIKYGKL